MVHISFPGMCARYVMWKFMVTATGMNTCAENLNGTVIGVKKISTVQKQEKTIFVRNIDFKPSMNSFSPGEEEI